MHACGLVRFHGEGRELIYDSINGRADCAAQKGGQKTNAVMPIRPMMTPGLGGLGLGSGSLTLQQTSDNLQVSSCTKADFIEYGSQVKVVQYLRKCERALSPPQSFGRFLIFFALLRL